MFVGHYGVSFAAKRSAVHLPLWVWFIAVQWLDVVWSGLVLVGVEKLRIVPGFTEANALDLYYLPFTQLTGIADPFADLWRYRRNVGDQQPRPNALVRCSRLLFTLDA